ncbi:MutS-related protein [Butyrivibrio hungatei]|uniref:MutS-related protein n=1 Tax=Butyrivibrio hungatei TaxID=185008 RepID=UPI0004204D95|nr:hypothetical protein [Butyrivibrio hungatei]
MDNSGLVYILGFLFAFIIIAYVLGVRDAALAKKNLIYKLKKNWGDSPKRKYKEDDFDHITGYYDNHREGFQVDDTTWNDLNMDGVFTRMNYCLSASGEEYLYYMLRTPKQTDDFENEEKKIKFFSENDEARLKYQQIFARIGRGNRYSIYDYLKVLNDVGNFSNTKHYLMIALIALTIVITCIKFELGAFLFLAAVVANVIMYFNIKGKIDPYLSTYAYILKALASAKLFKGAGYPELSDDIELLNKSYDSLKGFSNGANVLMKQAGGGSPADIIMDYVRMITHIDLIKFNKMYRQLMEKKDDLDVIITVIGRMDAYISIACYRESVKGQYCTPTFANGEMNFENVMHPLIENAVSNSIDTKKGVLLTGSNASGKSTFLKTIGINVLLAQSVHTVLAKSYKAPLLRIYSSMALKDDIYEGDSYYIVEIKSMKRIIDAAKEEGNPVLCFVDEVLRGTNTVERIAASTEILKFLTDSGVNCFAATHDIELTQLLKDKYDLYHFEGNVSDNDVHFDYMLKKGPATNRNAIKLLSVLGYDSSLVDNAQNLAEKFLNTGVWE